LPFSIQRQRLLKVASDWLNTDSPYAGTLQTLVGKLIPATER
jgi:hypothetical protein